MDEQHWRQDQHLVRCEWGPKGAAHVGADGAVVVVDVLSFTTSVSVLVERGAAVYPSRWGGSRAEDLAREHRAELAVGRRQVTAQSPWSLSPAALRRAPVPERVVLPSPNGSAIAVAARGLVLAACLRNASAVGRWLQENGFGIDRPVTVVPAGERWPDRSLRPAFEDLLGAGAVLASLDLPSTAMSPEAAVAATLHTSLDASSAVGFLRGCASGQELIRNGFGEDVEVAAEVDATDVVPLLQGGCFRQAPRQLL